MNPRPRPCRRLLAAGAMLLVAVGAFAAAPPPPRPKLQLDSFRWPPYYLDDPAKPGFVRELQQVCLPAMGYEARYWSLPLGQLFSALRSGRLDAHVVSHDPGREEYLVYGKVPLFTDAYRPIVRAGSPIRIAAFADFDRLRLGHLHGLRYTPSFHDYVYARIDAGTVEEAATNEDLLRLLVDGKVDVFVGLVSTNRWLARTLGLADRIQVLPFDVKTSDYFLAVARASPRIPDEQAFLDAFDRCLERLRQDGTLARLRADYGLD